jgi:ABC-type transport system involved in cytochrome c biogenesis permease subunit
MQKGEPFDRAAMTPVLGLLEAFQLVEQVALPLLVPPADPDADRGAWANVGASLMASLETRRVHPAVLHWASIATAYEQCRPGDLNRAVAAYRDWLAAQGLERELGKGRREHFFNRTEPFLKATVAYLLAFLATCAYWLGRSATLHRSAALLAGLAFALHTGGLVFRMVLEGRPPVTNLYSSAIFVGWGAVVLGLVIERFFRNGIGIAAASCIGVATQIIAHNLSLGGDTMQMMQAVLDNNFWLSTHVVVITLGYSAMLVAGFMAAGYILAGVATPWLSAAAARSLERMVYGVLCFATLFSFVGTMLGGIWADQSWGRFWGWDPKENGALMIVLWAAIYLHVRWGRLARAPALMAIAVGGNVVTAFSWFGVNMLGVGLHSYGFMDSAFRWLLAFVASQAVVACLGLLPQRLWRSFRSGSRAPAAVPAEAAQPGEGRRAGRPVRAPALAPAGAAARRLKAGRRRAARR